MDVSLVTLEEHVVQAFQVVRGDIGSLIDGTHRKEWTLLISQRDATSNRAKGSWCLCDHCCGRRKCKGPGSLRQCWKGGARARRRPRCGLQTHSFESTLRNIRSGDQDGFRATLVPRTLDATARTTHQRTQQTLMIFAFFQGWCPCFSHTKTF